MSAPTTNEDGRRKAARELHERALQYLSSTLRELARVLAEEIRRGKWQGLGDPMVLPAGQEQDYANGVFELESMGEEALMEVLVLIAKST